MRRAFAVVAVLDNPFAGRFVADLSPPGARAQVFAIYTVWINLAGAVMPGAGEAIVRRGGFFPLLGAAALALIAVLLSANPPGPLNPPSPPNPPGPQAKKKAEPAKKITTDGTR